MKVKSFVIVMAILILAETRCGSSQILEGFDPRVWAPPRECPTGTPFPVDEGKVCNDTSICQIRKPLTCYCDDHCLSYGDCCIDAPIRKKFPHGGSSIPRSRDFQYEECRPIDKGVNGYFMISRCPETFQDDKTRILCETEPDQEDLFLLTPVAHVAKARLFRNFYCAMCHETTLEDISFWEFTVECRDESGKENDDTSSSKPETTAIPDDGDTGVDDGAYISEDDNPVTDNGTSISEDDHGSIDDGISISEIYPPTPEVLHLLSLTNDPDCIGQFEDLHHSPNPYRWCKVIDVNHYVNDDDHKIPCPSYVDPYFTNGLIYKNRVCASCNDQDVSLSACRSKKKSVFDLHSFSKLFMLRDGYQTSPTGHINPLMCTESEVYDPYSKFCRPFVTSVEPKGLTSTKPQNTLEVTGEFYLQNAGCISGLSHEIVCEEINHIVELSLKSLITSFLPNFDGRLENILTSCYPHKDVSLCKDESSKTAICTFRGLLKSESLDEIRGLKPHLIDPLLDENYRHHGCASELTIDIQEILIVTAAGNTSCDESTSSNQTLSIAFTWKEVRKMTDVTFATQTCPDKMKCPWQLTRFEKSEYVFDGSDVILKNINQKFHKDYYRKLGNGSIAACVNLEHDRSDSEKLERYEKAQVILTGVGGSLSVVCLAATVLIYVIFPNLRNNMGKAILSLVFSLLIAQLFQLALWDETENENFCTFVAILSHYSFLAAFFWMSILGFDLSRIFGSRAKMQTVRDSRKVFFLYSLYGWFSPLLIVGACMAIHFGNFNKVNAANESVYLLQYGNQHICWIADQVALTYAFGVPIAVLLLCNAFFFADTVFGISSARAATRRATHTNPRLLRRDGKKDFLLFCKLSCIMGITWLFGFVAAFTDIQAFHIIFILLNSTQGVFIFLAFGCNARVIKMWRSKYTKQKLTSTRSNSYSVSAIASVNSISRQQVNQFKMQPKQV